MLIPASKLKSNGRMTRGLECGMRLCPRCAQTRSQTAAQAVCCRRPIWALAGTARAEFAHHLLGSSLQAADVHQEVVRSLPVQQRSGNCPTSHCRGLAWGEGRSRRCCGVGRPPNEVRSSNSRAWWGPHGHALGWANRSHFSCITISRQPLASPRAAGLASPRPAARGWNGGGTDCIPAFCDVDHRNAIREGCKLLSSGSVRPAHVSKRADCA
jgi:hypothetical protein